MSHRHRYSLYPSRRGHSSEQSSRLPSLRSGHVFFYALVLWSVGCTADTGTIDFTPAALEQFEQEVQPSLTFRCGSPVCHGQDSRPFALYSPGVRRMDADRSYSMDPLTDEESLANAYQVLAFTNFDSVEDSIILTKPQQRAEGSEHHDGGQLMVGPKDPLYRALLDWLRLGGQQ